MSETRFFDPGTVPEWATPDWYAGRERAPHLEQEPHRPRLEAAAHHVRQAIAQDPQLAYVLDFGAGDGGLLSLLADVPLTKLGIDLQHENVRGARERGVDVTFGNAYTVLTHHGHMLNPVLPAAVVVVTEFLEHLVDPHGFVRLLADNAVPWVVASSPIGETVESHYEFHLWSWDPDGYRLLFETNGYVLYDAGLVPGFQLVLAMRAAA